MFSENGAAVVIALSFSRMELDDVAGVNEDLLHVAVGWHQADVVHRSAIDASLIPEDHYRFEINVELAFNNKLKLKLSKSSETCLNP